MKTAFIAYSVIAFVALLHQSPAWAQRGERDEAFRHGWLSSLEEGKRQARTSGKPIMVNLRCVP